MFERFPGAPVGSTRGRGERRGGDVLRIPVQWSVQETMGPWRYREKDSFEKYVESGINRTVFGNGLPLMSQGTRVCKGTPRSVALANEQMAVAFIQIRKMGGGGRSVQIWTSYV